MTKDVRIGLDEPEHKRLKAIKDDLGLTWEGALRDGLAALADGQPAPQPDPPPEPTPEPEPDPQPEPARAATDGGAVADESGGDAWDADLSDDERALVEDAVEELRESSGAKGRGHLALMLSGDVGLVTDVLGDHPEIEERSGERWEHVG